MADRWEDYFGPGETLIWEGGPMPKYRPSLGIVLFAMFGLPFFAAGTAIVFASLARISSFGGVIMSVLLTLFSLPFLVAGAAMIFGPWYMRAMAHRKIRYALSNRQAYIASQWWGRRLRAFPIAPDAAITLEQGHSVFFHSDDSGEATARKGFENIRDAEHVYRLFRDVQAGLRDGGL